MGFNCAETVFDETSGGGVLDVAADDFDFNDFDLYLMTGAFVCDEDD